MTAFAPAAWLSLAREGTAVEIRSSAVNAKSNLRVI